MTATTKPAKISTADCKKALIAAFPAAYGAAPGDWKRISKTGSGRIERLFLHRTLPLKGVVVEDNGSITSSEITIILPWEEEFDTLVAKDEGLYDRVETNGTFIGKHVSPSLFAFSLYNGEGVEEGTTCVSISPLSYFKRIGGQYDGEMTDIMAELMGDSDSGCEVEEGSFIFELAPDEARQVMLDKGFTEDADFNRWMDPETRGK